MIKKFHENIWYGTFKECVAELWKVIDFDHTEMPRVDFAVSVMENASTAYEAYRNASGWFGIKNISEEFNADTISLIIARYGGGGIEGLELCGEDEEKEKADLMKRMSWSAGVCGYDLIKANDYTVFELE